MSSFRPFGLDFTLDRSGTDLALFVLFLQLRALLGTSAALVPAP
jgi:hypothetical protein